ncbi:helix-turn-helix transcriptional regulator [Dorea sp. ICN-14282]|uniref:helix-turn-helix transcriptional regulator n=1 Tax=Dorea sp. ICN-14282 TaxID=3134654 RepID=UPI0030BD993C
MALNDNIKKLREEKNLTQQQLADKLYVSRQTICRWENGSRCPDLITAKKLALELDVSMDELIADEDVRDVQINYGIWKLEKIKSRVQLREEREKVQKLIEIIGSIYMGILILGLRPEVQTPVWITIIFACIVILLLIVHLMISKKLREIE